MYGVEEGERHHALVIDTPEGIELFRLLSMRGRLQLERDTGLRFRLSTLKAVNKRYGTKFRSRDKAIARLQQEIDERTAPIVEDPA